MSQEELYAALEAKDIQTVRFYAEVFRALSGRTAAVRKHICKSLEVKFDDVSRMPFEHGILAKIAEVLGAEKFDHISPASFERPPTHMETRLAKQRVCQTDRQASKEYAAGIPSFKGQKFSFTTSTKTPTPEYFAYLQREFLRCPSSMAQTLFLRREKMDTALIRRKFLRAKEEKIPVESDTIPA